MIGISFARIVSIAALLTATAIAQKLPATASLRARVAFLGKPAPAGITLRATYPGGEPQFQAATDAQGVADFGRVPAGNYRITRGAGDVASFLAPIKDGESKTFDIAMTGRPVIGRIVLPPGPRRPLLDPISVLIDPLHFPTYTIPANFLQQTPADRSRWYDTLEASTPDGRAVVQRRERAEEFGSRYVHVDPDLSFGIVGAEEGPHWFKLFLDSHQITAAVYRFDVPPIAGGASLEPLDVGALKFQSAETFDAGQTVPDIVFKTADGADHLLSEFRGKTVFLDFWGVWCTFCIKDMPNIKALHEAHAIDPSFVMISLSVDDTFDVWKKYIDANAMTWTQGFLGPREAAWPTKALGVVHYPTCFLIGPDGRLIATAMQSEALRPYIESALRAKR